MHRAALALLVLAVAGGVAATAGAASPAGSWTREDGRIYKFVPISDGFARYSMTQHRTGTNRCLVKPNTLVYRYHALGGGLFEVDALYWRSDCSSYWENGTKRIRIAATATRLTLSCTDDLKKTCWTYHRAKQVAAPADTKAPVVLAVYSAGKVGGLTTLRYVVTDDSGKTWEALYLYKDGVIARQYKTPLGPAEKGRMYGYKLQKTPASFRGTFAFCVVSHDAAGHTSDQSCGTVTIK